MNKRSASLFRLLLVGTVALALACADSVPGSAGFAAESEYAEVVQRLSRFVEHELADKEIPAISVALVDDQETVWAAGFGMQDPDAGVPATPRDQSFPKSNLCLKF